MPKFIISKIKYSTLGKKGGIPSGDDLEIFFIFKNLDLYSVEVLSNDTEHASQHARREAEGKR